MFNNPQKIFNQFSEFVRKIVREELAKNKENSPEVQQLIDDRNSIYAERDIVHMTQMRLAKLSKK